MSKQCTACVMVEAPPPERCFGSAYLAGFAVAHIANGSGIIAAFCPLHLAAFRQLEAAASAWRNGLVS